MGQSKIGSLLVERCLAFCGQCEDHLLLSCLLVALTLLFEVHHFKIHTLPGYI